MYTGHVQQLEPFTEFIDTNSVRKRSSKLASTSVLSNLLDTWY
ncbi:hypothetical protein MEG1DRAFT_04034 [Photorhabdus temperata subsp. temperata Meg1]|uniref:Uncharacterized protein n=1 Tax=Photorhabdus temperata subsp. temperata Meg1 TaxID=1393735 RepID=A0A081RRR1_PHOTE|nr:hypothetical protein MEG1DRAFT_04034 [Photorhabdus temperata subsp. temperata Meg1]